MTDRPNDLLQTANLFPMSWTQSCLGLITPPSIFGFVKLNRLFRNGTVRPHLTRVWKKKSNREIILTLILQDKRYTRENYNKGSNLKEIKQDDKIIRRLKKEKTNIWNLHKELISLSLHDKPTKLIRVKSVPYPFATEHLYDPTSFVCTLESWRTFSVFLNWFSETPSLVQVMVGCGSPSALQVRVKFSPALTMDFLGGATLIFGGTMKLTKTTN